MEQPVYFDKAWTKRCFWLLLAMQVGLPLVAILALSETRGAAFWFVLLIGISWMLMIPFTVVMFQRWRSDEPAMVILDEGLIIGFLPFEKMITMNWEEISCAYEGRGCICVLPASQKAFLASRPLLSRLAGLSTLHTYGTLLALSPATVDINWEEFSELVEDYTRIGVHSDDGVWVAKEGARPVVTPEQEAFIAQFKADLDNRLTLDGKLRTVADYDRHFENDLIGIWQSDVGMPSPVDKDVAFYSNGQGYVQGAFFNGYSGQFEWRRLAPGSIEIKSIEKGSGWVPITWQFELAANDNETRPWMTLSIDDWEHADDAGSTKEVAIEMTLTDFAFSGLPSKEGPEA